ncbi:MAG: HD domain-containing protein [Dehalococcoidia bacterium]|nr:HD domain-containing protein [Dehalococcoidia bacterium]
MVELSAKTKEHVSHPSRMTARPTGSQARNAPEQDARLNLLCEVGKIATSLSRASGVVDEVVTMTREALKASASSVLLLDRENRQMRFEFADGEAGEAVRKVTLDIDSGIAGWVAKHREPLVVNDVSADERFCSDVDSATGFLTRSMICAPLIVHDEVMGVIEVINKLDGGCFTAGDLDALVSVASTAAIAIDNSRLHQSLVEAYKSTIRALAAAVDAKDPYTRGHSQRVVRFAMAAGMELSLPPKDLQVLEYAGILHDIGKIGIPDSLLGKAGPLTTQEYRIMREHPVIGAGIIEGIPFLSPARPLILYHHERYDGTGYPARLKGDDIPVGARLLAVGDALDTMTTNRPYRAALDTQRAICELRNCSGTQLCPTAVEAFIRGFEKRLRPGVEKGFRKKAESAPAVAT